MLPDTTDIVVLILWLAWAVLSRTSRATKSSMFEKFFPAEASIMTAAALSLLSFAPGLMEAIHSPTAGV
jgi:hypothetical protein